MVLCNLCPFQSCRKQHTQVSKSVQQSRNNRTTTSTSRIHVTTNRNTPRPEQATSSGHARITSPPPPVTPFPSWMHQYMEKDQLQFFADAMNSNRHTTYAPHPQYTGTKAKAPKPPIREEPLKPKQSLIPKVSPEKEAEFMRQSDPENCGYPLFHTDKDIHFGGAHQSLMPKPPINPYDQGISQGVTYEKPDQQEDNSELIQRIRDNRYAQATASSSITVPAQTILDGFYFWKEDRRSRVSQALIFVNQRIRFSTITIFDATIVFDIITKSSNEKSTPNIKCKTRVTLSYNVDVIKGAATFQSIQFTSVPPTEYITPSKENSPLLLARKPNAQPTITPSAPPFDQPPVYTEFATRATPHTTTPRWSPNSHRRPNVQSYDKTGGEASYYDTS